MTPEQLKLLLNPPDDGTIPDAGTVFDMTLGFVRSEFYRQVWKPKLMQEIELAKLNAKLADQPHVRLSWLDRMAALEAIEEAWFPEWLADKQDEEPNEEEYQL